MSFDNAHKLIHNIDSDGCGPPENCEKNFGPSQLENRNMAFDTRKDYHHPEAAMQAGGKAGSEAKIDLCTTCILTAKAKPTTAPPPSG
jgi:hypothetical protein